MIALVVLALVACRKHDEQPRAVATDGDRAHDEAARVARRRACGLEAGATLHEPDSVQGECQRAARMALESPTTAAFPGMFDPDEPPVSPFGCAVVYRSWVESRDASGAEVRRRYSCTYDPRTGVASVEFL